MNLPQRRDPRLKEYDYRTPGCYFVTICTHNKQKAFGKIMAGMGKNVGGGLCAAPPTVALSEIGVAVEHALINMAQYIPAARVDTYCIMPDHIHLIVVLAGGHGDPPLHTVIGRFKSYTQYAYRESGAAFGPKLWQRGYYEHIVRNEQELNEIRQYIQNNPLAEVIS